MSCFLVSQQNHPLAQGGRSVQNALIHLPDQAFATWAARTEMGEHCNLIRHTHCILPQGMREARGATGTTYWMVNGERLEH